MPCSPRRRGTVPGLLAVSMWLALWCPTLAAQPDEPATVDPPAGVTRSLPRPTNLSVIGVIGTSGTGPVEFHRPGGLVATPVDGVLVADTGNIRVQHLTLDGQLRWEAGGIGTDEGALARPTAVALASSLNYLVLDSLAGKVLEFHARGEYLGLRIDVADAAGRSNLGEVEPRGIGVDRSGNTIISDREGDRLLIFAPDGALLYDVGGFGSDPQSFEDPEGIAVSRHHIYVADSMNGRVQVLDRLGTFVDAWELPGGGAPMAVAVDRHGNVYVSDAAGDRVVAFTPGGVVACTSGATGSGPGSFRRPTGLCIIGDRLIVADADNDRLQVFRIRYDSGP